MCEDLVVGDRLTMSGSTGLPYTFQAARGTKKAGYSSCDQLRIKEPTLT